VFLGDAVHTAHYTVGSGTALAIEDALALAEALDGASSPAAAFNDYESVRKPIAQRLQQRAERSERWWSSLATRYDLPLRALVVSYLSRTGAVGLSEIAGLDGSAPAQGTGGDTDGGTDCSALADQALSQPFTSNGTSLRSRVYTPLAPQGTGDVLTLTVPTGTVPSQEDLARELAVHGASYVRLVGEGGREGLLDRLELAEALRARTGATTIVRGSADAVEDLALGILSHRTDLVEIAAE
jgi:anthraniloyl-CoA monooxygenase